MWLVVSLRSYAVRHPTRVRQQCTVKSPLLLSTLVVISLYKEEKKLAGPMTEKELSAKGCSRTGVFNPRPAGRLRPSGDFLWPGKGISQNTMRC